MIIDKLLSIVFGTIGWLIDLMPDMPKWSFDISTGMPSFFREGLRIASIFLDVGVVLQNFVLVLACSMAILSWSALNWVINKVRGSG